MRSLGLARFEFYAMLVLTLGWIAGLAVDAAHGRHWSNIAFDFAMVLVAYSALVGAARKVLHAKEARATPNPRADAIVDHAALDRRGRVPPRA